MTSTMPAVPDPAVAENAARQEYLTSREAAAYLHLNHRTFMSWVKDGIIPGIPLGGGKERKTWLFCRSTLDEHLRGMMTTNRPRSH